MIILIGVDMKTRVALCANKIIGLKKDNILFCWYGLMKFHKKGIDISIIIKPNINFQILTPAANMIKVPNIITVTAVPKSGWLIIKTKGIKIDV